MFLKPNSFPLSYDLIWDFLVEAYLKLMCLYLRDGVVLVMHVIDSFFFFFLLGNYLNLSHLEQ